jgi:hypothetical protein
VPLGVGDRVDPVGLDAPDAIALRLLALAADDLGPHPVLLASRQRERRATAADPPGA